MSTRGAIGFYRNGREKVGYNHFDSYPEGLGVDVLAFLKGKTIWQLKEICDRIKLVDDGPDALVDGKAGLEFNQTMNDCHTFLYDSLFCEYAYIINLDEEVLEFYVGFNKAPGGFGRYADKTVDEDKRYYGVVLEKRISLQKCFQGKVKVTKTGFEEE